MFFSSESRLDNIKRTFSNFKLHITLAIELYVHTYDKIFEIVKSGSLQNAARIHRT